MAIAVTLTLNLSQGNWFEIFADNVINIFNEICPNELNMQTWGGSNWFQHLQETLLLVGWSPQHFNHSTAILWYHIKHQLLLKMIWLFSWNKKLPSQQKSLAKPLHIWILAAHISETNSVTPIFSCTKVIGMPEWSFLRSWKKNLTSKFRATLNNWKFKIALNPLL